MLTSACNHLWFSGHQQVSALSIPDKSCTNSPTPKGGKAWWAWAGTPKQEPGIRCVRQPEPPSDALHLVDSFFISYNSPSFLPPANTSLCDWETESTTVLHGGWNSFSENPTHAAQNCDTYSASRHKRHDFYDTSFESRYMCKEDYNTPFQDFWIRTVESRRVCIRSPASVRFFQATYNTTF